MTKSSKTPQAAPEIHAPEVDDQEPRIETRLNPAGLTICCSGLLEGSS